MIEGLKPYPSYKETGIPWLGKVPEYWEVRRLHNVTELRVSNVDKHTKEGELPIRLCNYVDVYKNDQIFATMRFMQASASEEEIREFQLKKGDVLITKDSEIWNDIAVPAIVESSAPDLLCGYHLAILRPIKGIAEGKFLFRVLQSQKVIYQFHVEATGVTRYGLSQQAIKSGLTPLPPLSEQTAIVEYLDTQTAKIDTAIATTRREIELLREFRTRLISDVVTGKVDVREVAEQLPEEPELPEEEELEPANEVEIASGDTEESVEEENADDET